MPRVTGWAAKRWRELVATAFAWVLQPAVAHAGTASASDDPRTAAAAGVEAELAGRGISVRAQDIVFAPSDELSLIASKLHALGQGRSHVRSVAWTVQLGEAQFAGTVEVTTSATGRSLVREGRVVANPTNLEGRVLASRARELIETRGAATDHLLAHLTAEGNKGRSRLVRPLDASDFQVSLTGSSLHAEGGDHRFVATRRRFLRSPIRTDVSVEVHPHDGSKPTFEIREGGRRP